MSTPVGNYLATTRKGALNLSPPIRRYCSEQGWARFEVLVLDHDHLILRPDPDGDTLLDADGKLALAPAVIEAIELGEQSVMLRIESGLIHVAIRQVFDTLGFRPR